MIKLRATILSLASLPLAALPLVVLAVPAAAQVDDAVVIDIIRQCARIDDATARLACYDNNVRVGNTSVARTSVPGAMARPQAPFTSTPNSNASGFGREDVRGPERFETPEGEVDEITARVRTVEVQSPGVYLITLEDGALWAFSETVDFAYRPPRAGASITIDRGAINSFLMVYDRQRSVRIRRIR